MERVRVDKKCQADSSQSLHAEKPREAVPQAACCAGEAVYVYVNEILRPNNKPFRCHDTFHADER